MIYIGSGMDSEKRFGESQAFFFGLNPNGVRHKAVAFYNAIALHLSLQKTFRLSTMGFRAREGIRVCAVFFNL